VAVYPPNGGWFKPLTHLSNKNKNLNLLWQFIRQMADGLSHSPISPVKSLHSATFALRSFSEGGPPISPNLYCMAYGARQK
jgi:hypothetical protein